jgi:putative membrane protein
MQEDTAMDVFTLAPVAHAGPGGPGIFGPLIFLFWIGVVFFVVRFLIRGKRPWRDDATSMDRAEDLLAERFARGEIEAEEYQARSRALRELRQREPSPMDRVGGMYATRSAHSILAERYARGEIEADEYRRRLEDLKG